MRSRVATGKSSGPVPWGIVPPTVFCVLVLYYHIRHGAPFTEFFQSGRCAR
ncbi:hypothetical protein [Escherichia phage UPEC01]|nr:hypothetical protein [Escherichia phage UPEC01]